MGQRGIKFRNISKGDRFGIQGFAQISDHPRQAFMSLAYEDQEKLNQAFDEVIEEITESGPVMGVVI